jgi:SAM-dependent methyltransferase
MPNLISYRDTAARVVLEEGIYYRYIFDEYKAEYDHLTQSGLLQALTEKGLIIAQQEEVIVQGLDLPKHTQLQLQNQSPNKLYKKLKPQQIPFQSYPFEWSYSQWRKVMYAYLQINQIALAHGMILKDATPYNFYFEEGKAVLFDTSSFSFFKEGDPWMAYRQFCSEMLGPFALMHYNGQRWARLSQSHLRGLPLNFVSKQLPLKSWLNMTCLLHIHLHGKYATNDSENSSLRNLKKSGSEKSEEGSAERTNKEISNQTKQKGFSKEKIVSLMKMLQSTIVDWKKPFAFEKHWIDYYQKDIASDKYLKHKEFIIKDWLSQLTKQNKIPSILDLGANTGKFSLLASEYADKVIALEYDDICVDAIDKAIVSSKQKNIFCLRMDLAETTPNMGVLEKEFNSIYTRAKSSMVFGLALIHHLFISNQLSFFKISSILDRFSDKNVIVEFIPITDEKVQFLIKDKQRDYQDYTEEGFTKALDQFFQIKERIQLEGSERVLYLLEKQ